MPMQHKKTPKQNKIIQKSGLNEPDKKLIGDYMKSAEEAVKLMEFIQAQRPVLVKESIHYEKV